MKRIALISDNHSHSADEIIPFLEEVDEVWHAGDIGSLESIDAIKDQWPIIGVYGNIDGKDVRAEYPLNQVFHCEEVKVVMTHIGGYPGRYTKRVYGLLQEEKPQLYICGHSHICKVLYDKKLELLHMNPGAYGKIGWHKIRTILRFTIDGSDIKDAQVVELGRR